MRAFWVPVVLATCGLAFTRDDTPAFVGTKAGQQREVAGVKLCWCPPGKFTMGSPETEPDHRPDEKQVEVTLTKGFWTAKYETTQGQWKRVVGKLPGKATTELPEDDDLPVGNVNFAQAEEFCRKLTELGRKDGTLPKDWEFRLPTEAQWEYACRAGMKTATSFGDKLGTKQANFKHKPYNGAEEGPEVGKAVKVGSYPANAWAYTTCTATRSSGAGTGITPNCRGVWTRICTRRKRRPPRTGTGRSREFGGAGHGPTRGSIADRRCG